jgi:hypothetical protein
VRRRTVVRPPRIRQFESQDGDTLNLFAATQAATDGAPLGDLVLAAVISGGVASALVGLLVRLFFDRRLTRATEEVKAEVARTDFEYRADREWRERALAEVLGPVYMQMDRNSRAVRRWRGGNPLLEEKIVRQGNIVIRDLLVTKAHLLPPALLEPAGQLIAHYDRWLEEFDHVRGGEHPDLSVPFVRVTEEGFRWPEAAAEAFRDTFHRMWTGLYAPTMPV